MYGQTSKPELIAKVVRLCEPEEDFSRHVGIIVTTEEDWKDGMPTNPSEVYMLGLRRFGSSVMGEIATGDDVIHYGGSTMEFTEEARRNMGAVGLNSELAHAATAYRSWTPISEESLTLLRQNATTWDPSY